MKHLLILLLLLSGCGQRQVKYYEYDETNKVHKEWEYKSNRIFMFEKVDSVFIDLPSKGKVMVGPVEFNPDDVNLGYGPWWFGSKGDSQ
jgi:hypothetical protein